MGPMGAFRTTVSSTEMLIKSLLELGKNLEGLFPEDKVHIRSLLTDTNEHFHSRIRAWREMPSLLELLQRFTREVLEVAKRSASNVGFHVYTGKRSLHQRPDQRGTVWSKIVPETARHKPKPKFKRTSWAKLRERCTPQRGSPPAAHGHAPQCSRHPR